MDRKHHRNRLLWESITTLSIALIVAAVIALLITEQGSAILSITIFVISAVFLGLSIRIRAELHAQEDKDVE
jgi:hypothetical protein